MSGNIIKSIARAFGWDLNEFWVIPGEACCPYDTTEGFSLIVFAAYAKAELAKRGWVNHISGSVVWAQHAAEGTRTDVFSFRRTCPISEAEAVLQCIAECLDLMSDQTHESKGSRAYDNPK